MIKTIRAIDVKSTYTHPKISVVSYLFMREIIFQTYSIDHVLETLEGIIRRIPEHLENRHYHNLFEEMVFLNFCLSIIKKNDHQIQSGFQYSNLILGQHIPTFEILKSIIEFFII